MSWLGAAPATRKNFEMMLKEDSVAVVIGGLAEMYMQVRDSTFDCCCAPSGKFKD